MPAQRTWTCVEECFFVFLGADFNSGSCKRQFIVGESLRLGIRWAILVLVFVWGRGRIGEKEELRRGEAETP